MRYINTVLSLAAFLSFAGHAHADEPSTEGPAVKEFDQDQTDQGRKVTTLKPVTITAPKLSSSDQATATGSRLGLPAQETPATVNSIDNDEMTERGLHAAADAAATLPGVTSGGAPGDIMQFSMRGFTGNQVTTLHNGLYFGPATMVNRSQNTFNLDTVEVLQGPASVLYGQGAVGGVVNFINKMPDFGETSMNSELTYGSFNSAVMGVGASTHWGDTLAFRSDISRTSTDGYVDGASASSLNSTQSFLWRPNPDLNVRFTFDYLDDRPSDYFGTPLLPKSSVASPLSGVISSSSYAIDKRTQYNNYNVSDADIYSHQYWPQIQVKWSPSSNWTFENTSYYLQAKRKWFDAETYSNYDLTTGMIGRDRFFVTHDQSLAGDQGTATYQAPLLGLNNKVVAGFDYSHLDFKRVTGFPDASIYDYVNLLSSNQGLFGSFPAASHFTYWNNAAGFLEDVLSLTPSLKLVTGGRFDYLDLDRENYNSNGSYNSLTSFHRAYQTTNWRTGLVYDINKVLTSYASFTTGADPAGSSNIFLVNANQNFKMSSSRQYEIGLKGATADGRLDGTLALYDITRDNMLFQTGTDTVTSGSERSKGIEVSLNTKLNDHWKAGVNGAYTEAAYGTFFTSGVDLSGRQPIDVPRWTSNLWLSYDHIAGLPWKIGGDLRYVGKQYANYTTDVTLDAYTLVDLFTSYEFKPGLAVVGRVNNLFDRAYVQWADPGYSENELVLGAPRSFEASLVVKF